jgi:HNH endonuclease
MAILLRRQISDEEKKRILERFGRICYATGHEIPETEDLQYDHIKAFAEKGASDIDNIAPMCKTHNLQKGRLALEDFRTKLKMNEFFSRGNALTLKNELEYFKEKNTIDRYGESIYFTKDENEIEVEINSVKSTFRLYQCPTTKWEYFYAILPVEVINSDDDEEGEIGLQPRYLIQDKVFNLYRHFQIHPVLQPSIARINKNKILVFDGQHKIAAMLWGNRKEFELKIYLNPDPQLLNKTNISAHDKFAQTRFYSSIMVSKLGSQFGKLFEEYKNLEDNATKSEKGFTEYLKNSELLSNGEVNKRFRSFLYNSVLDEEINKLARLVSKSNRSSDEYPITIDMLSKSLLSNFIYLYPVEEDLISDKYIRGVEINNVIRLFNIIDEEILNQWDSTKPKNDQGQLKLKRLVRSKSIMSWSEILKDAIAAKLDIFDADEKAILFYRILKEEDFDKIREIVRRLINWSLWNLTPNSDIDRILSDNKHEIKKFFREKGLTTGYLMGAPE